MLNPPPLVSVILCVYNRIRLLPRALNSVINQTFKDYELIIVDDGSTDKINELISSSLNERLNYTYIRHDTNSGISMSRNTGVKASQGKYITFIDSDDEYKNIHLEKMIEIMKDKPEIDFIHSFPEVVGDEKDDMWLPSIEGNNKLIHINDCVFGATFFAKKEVFREMGGYKNVSFSEDGDFFKRLSLLNKFKIYKAKEKTYIYYRNVEDSICNILKRINS